MLDFFLGEPSRDITDLFNEFPQIKGFIDYNMKTDFYLPVFSSIHANKAITPNKIEQNNIRQNLENSVEELKKNLELVKDIHAKMVPQREFQVKGLNIKAKFISGENSGGEFFDFSESNGKLSLILTSTSSYIVSTIVLGEFADFTKAKDFSVTALTSFCLSLAKQMEQLKLEQNENNLDLFIASIDSRTLEVTGYNVGMHDIVSLNKNVKVPYTRTPFPLELEKSFFKFNLDRSDRFMLLSSGFYRNIDTKMREDFHQRVKESLKNDLDFSQINDLFFEIKKKRKEQFLVHDASCIYLMVDKNAIFEV